MTTYTQDFHDLLFNLPPQKSSIFCLQFQGSLRKLSVVEDSKVISEYESAESLFGFRDPDSWIQESPGPESYSGLGVRVLGNLLKQRRGPLDSEVWINYSS